VHGVRRTWEDEEPTGRESAMSTCRSCNAPILWARSAKGKRRPMPLDPEPVPGGNVELVDGEAWVVKPDPNVPRYVSHFATCPNAGQHRRAR